MATQLARPDGPAPSGRLSAATIFMVAVALLLLTFRFIVPQVAGEIQYSLTLGKLRAESSFAREQLARGDVPSSFKLVAQSVAPAVVHIRTLTSTGMPTPAPKGKAADDPRYSGEGSGIIVDSEGYILTNHHVALSGDDVWVKFVDGRIQHAELVGVDALTDLALLKIKPEGPVISAPWGDSQELSVGDWVVAVGSPFGLDRSVTAGIVSAKGRQNLVDNDPYQDFIQSDAAVNPGNSGGPLVNVRGEVVGVNTLILGQRFQGVSFAIPSSIARDVCERLKRDGKVRRAWLGVALDDVTPELDSTLKLGGRPGAVVLELVVNTPAQRAGLKPRDVIVSWNGQNVSSATDLRLKVARTEIQSLAQIEVLREGKPEKFLVTVVERPDFSVPK
ncbi:MAG TPA: trypsin-like peptidase domain-containing protein [Pirellulales bacterium]